MGKPAANTVLDYFHINSVGETTDGNLLISGRNTSALYKVDRKSGDIIWRLGGKKSDFSFSSSDAQFHWQHDGRAWSDTLYSVFDNGANSSEARSRGLLLNVDESAKTRQPRAGLPAPRGVRLPGAGQRHAPRRRAGVRRLGRSAVLLGVRLQRRDAARRAAAGRRALLPGVHRRLGRQAGRPAGGRGQAEPIRRIRRSAQAGTARRRSRAGRSSVERAHRSWRRSANRSGRDSRRPSRSTPSGPSFQVVALDSSGNELGRSEVV